MSNEVMLKPDEIFSELSAKNPEVVLPSGYCAQRSPAAILQSKDDSAMSATFAIVTRTSTPNRYGNQLQLLPNAYGRGPVTEYYDKAPVVLFDHGLSGVSLPVGLCAQNGVTAIGWTPDKGIATCYFADKPWAEPIYAAVSDGLLRMASIGFDPWLAMRIKPMGPQQAAAPDGVMDLTYLGLDFTEWELLEWSITAIGADRGALRQCLDRGSINGVKLPNFLKQSFALYAAELQKFGIGADLSPKRVEPAVQQPKDIIAGVAYVQQATPVCTDCGGKLQCMQCMKQMEEETDVDATDDPPDPDIAPDVDMSYAATVAQHCAGHLQQSQVNEVQKIVMQGAATAVRDALKPVADQIKGAATEFQRMRGKVNG